MANVIKQCLKCTRSFETVFRKGTARGKFCGLSCANSFNARNRKVVIKSKIPNVSCAICNHKYYLNNSQKKNSKSGLFFCSYKCKHEGQKWETGLSQVHPPHYKDGSSTYSRRAKELTQECGVCGYNKIPQIMEVHHIDRNRANNKLDNLLVLCPTCHEEEHYMQGDGKYAKHRTGKNKKS